MKNINKGLRLIYGMWIIGWLFVLSAGFFLISPTAQAFTFTTINVPLSTFTVAAGINSFGQIVGSFGDTSGVYHGFLRDKKGNLTTIDDPSAGSPSGQGTYAFGINDFGEIVGEYFDSSGVNHGYLRDIWGHFTTIDVPNSVSTTATGITLLGQIVGYSKDNIGIYHGFILDIWGTFTTIDDPNARSSLNSGTFPNGISNNSAIVGGFWGSDGFLHGFLRDKKANFTTIDPPGSNYREATGINSSGQIVGIFHDQNTLFCFLHGFLRDKKGNFTQFNDPDAGGFPNCPVYEEGTWPMGISNNGKIVGFFIDSGRKAHGFLATP